MNTLTAQQQQELAILNANNTADYKQLNASLSGVLNQYATLNSIIGSIPTTETKTTQLTDIGALTTTPVEIATHTFVMPYTKDSFSVFAEMDATPGAVSPDPTMVINVVVAIPGRTFGSNFTNIPTGGTASGSNIVSVTWALAPGESVTVRYFARANSSTITSSVLNVVNCNSLITWS